MDEKERRSALQAEYMQLQKVIEDFDGRALTIKAWSISFSLVAIGTAFATKADAIFAVSCVSALLFWYLEASWKTFQYAFYDRAGDIEAFFRGEKTIEAPFQIGSSWYRRWRAGGRKRLLRILFWPHVALPHAAVAVLAAVLFSFAMTD